MTTTERPKSGYKVIGTTPLRTDALDKLTGRAVYGADIKLPGMLSGEILRSPHAHANIKKLDTSKAEKMLGVMAVVTAKDMPEVESKIVGQGEAAYNLAFTSDQVMAKTKVSYKGQPVAAVAAIDHNTAMEALKLIDVEYELLPQVVTVDEALAPGAPIIHDSLIGDDLGTKVPHTNMAKRSRHEFGDLEKGYKESTLVIEREFHLATVHQGYIEPHACVVRWNADDTLTVWVSTQGSFQARNQISQVMNIPESRIKVIPTELGGGFGGKHSLYLKPSAIMLAKKTGRPVKMVMDRRAEFDSTGPTPGAKIKIKLGVDDKGIIKAGEADLWYEAGAYPGAFIAAGMMCVFAGYKIANLRIDGYDVVVNKPKSIPYRAPCATQAAFAMETTVDEICEALKMDPYEFRLKNASQEGDRQPDGPSWPRIGNIEVQQAAMNSEHYRSKLERKGPDGKLRGRGTAIAFWAGAGLRSSVNLNVELDGTVTLIMGSVDIGGGTRIVMAMIAAEVLGIPVEHVRPSFADTESVGYSDGTFGSRTTNATGHATFKAAHTVIDMMTERAARLWDLKTEDIQFEDGVFKSKADTELKITFKDLCAKFTQTGGPVASTGTVMVRANGGGFSSSIADVEVDPETGKVDVVRVTMVQDAGTAIHPQMIEGQMQGGVAQAIGWALHEEYYMNDQGVMANSTLLDYRMPTALDLPMIDTIIVEVPNPAHPLGVRGVGETCIVPNVPAIANAIHDAIGVRPQQTPMKPGRVLELLAEKQKNGA